MYRFKKVMVLDYQLSSIKTNLCSYQLLFGRTHRGREHIPTPLFALRKRFIGKRTLEVFHKSVISNQPHTGFFNDF